MVQADPQCFSVTARPSASVFDTTEEQAVYRSWPTPRGTCWTGTDGAAECIDISSSVELVQVSECTEWVFYAQNYDARRVGLGSELDILRAPLFINQHRRRPGHQRACLNEQRVRGRVAELRLLDVIIEAQDATESKHIRKSTLNSRSLSPLLFVLLTHSPFNCCPLTPTVLKALCFLYCIILLTARDVSATTANIPRHHHLCEGHIPALPRLDTIHYTIQTTLATSPISHSGVPPLHPKNDQFHHRCDLGYRLPLVLRWQEQTRSRDQSLQCRTVRL